MVYVVSDPWVDTHFREFSSALSVVATSILAMFAGLISFEFAIVFKGADKKKRNTIDRNACFIESIFVG